MTEYVLHRFISTFEKDGDAHVRDVEFVEQPGLNFLQRLFDVPADDPMFDLYPIDARIAKELRSYLPFGLDPEKYDYFIECAQR